MTAYFNRSFLLTLPLKPGHEPISRAKQIGRYLQFCYQDMTWIGIGFLGLGWTNIGA